MSVSGSAVLGAGAVLRAGAAKRRRGRRAGRFASIAARFALACAAAWSGAAQAQTTPDAPAVISPLRAETDLNDVNLVTGKTVLKMPTISVPAAPNLRFDWVQNAAPYVSGTITAGEPAQASYSVHTGSGTSESFRCPDFDCSTVNGGGSVTGTGSTFVPTVNRFRQAGTGALYHYDLKHVNAQGPTTRTILYYASRIDYPDGETISYSYDTATLAGDSYNRTFYRPNRIASSRGYSIAISYQTNDFGQNAWGSPAQATLYADADPATPLARLTYSGNTITDLAGRTFTCTGCSNALGSNLETAAGSLQLPGEAAPAEQVVANPNTYGTAGAIVASVVRDGVTWTYSYANLRTDPSASAWLYDSLTVTGPNGYSRTHQFRVVTDSVGQIAAQTRRHIELVATTDALARTTSYMLDNASRPVGAVLPEGNRIDIVYDDWGNVVSKTTTPKPGSGQAAVTETAYVDAVNCANTGAPVLCYRPVWTRDALGRETDYVYNTAGQVTEKTEPADANGVRRKTIVAYDATSGISRPGVVRVCGLGTTCGTPDEVRTEYSYWGATLLPLTESRVDARAGVTLTTTYSYDSAGRLLSKDGPLPGSDDAVTYRYDALGRRTWEIGPKDSNGLRSARTFAYRDSDDKVTLTRSGTVTDPNNPVLTELERIEAGYDAHRNAVREAVSAGGTVYGLTERSFDDRGQLVCQAQRMNAANFAAATDGCALAGGAEPDRITRNVYDAAGQLTTVQKAYLTSLQQNYATYEYTPNGKQKAVIDANGNRAEMTYDGFDRQKRWIFPSPTTAGLANQADYEEYGYDPLGNRTSLRKRDGVTLTYFYDGMNRLTQKNVPPSATGAAGYSLFYGYDVNGLQVSARFGSASGPGIATSYDGFGRVAATTTTMDGVARTASYSYDAHGNRLSMSLSSGYYLSFAYDAADRMTGVSEAGPNPIAAFTYDAAQRRSGLALGSGGTFGSSVSYGYDAVGRLATLGHDLAGTGWDQALTFGYNAASQIVTRTSSNDLYASNSAYNVSRPYSVNGLNQYTAAGGASFTYDANGNLTSDGSSSFVYDAENRLVSRSNGTTLAYDPNGRLWQVSGPSETTRFLYDGDRLVEEYDASGTRVRAYAHGPGNDEPLVWYELTGGAMRRYLHADHQGSIVALTDENGNLVHANAYDPWGIRNAGDWGRFGYTGQVWLADLGMYYYKARIYSPTLGRFLQTDPIGYHDQIDLYAYVENDPINHQDPSGTHCTGSKIDCGGLEPGRSGSSTGSAGFVATGARAGQLAARAAGAAEAAGTAGAAATAGALGSTLLLCGDSAQGCQKQEDYWYVTYTKTKVEGGRTVTYSGRTAGSGRTPQEVLQRRDRGHHMNAAGFGPARIDRSIHSERSTFGNPAAAAAIRGREQMLIDHFGGARSSGGTSGNSIDGVSPLNPLRSVYIGAALAYFGSSF